MTTFQAHESEFRDHVAPPVPHSELVSETIASGHHVNGDAALHNATVGLHPAPLEMSELSSSDLHSSKLNQRSPSPLDERMNTSENAHATSSQPMRDTMMTYKSETTATAADPISSVITTTIFAEPSHPEPLHEQISVSPETKMQMAAPLGMANDIGQPATSDERNAPFEEPDFTSEIHKTEVVSMRNGPDMSITTLETSNEEFPTASHLQDPISSDTTISAVHEVPQISHIPESSVPTDVAEVSHVPESSVMTDVAEIAKIPRDSAVHEIAEAHEVPTLAPEPALAMAFVDEKMEDMVSSNVKIAREREDDDVDVPEAKRTKIGIANESSFVTESVEPKVEAPLAAVEPTAETTINDVTMTTPMEEAVTNGSLISVAVGTAAAAAEGAAAVAAVDAAASAPPEDWGPMTEAQSKQLKQNLQNLKKGKHATNFSKPVDAVALKIPQYYDIITNPMDLGTMDQKLKEGKYSSVSEFVADFNLIIDNCVRFNGPTHAVTVSSMNMKAQFGAGLKKIPKSGEIVEPVQKKQRQSSFALPARETKRRESRPSLGSAISPTGTTLSQTFALGQDGVPLTRRTSAQDGRPKREIHRPPPRDLPYLSAKPKKKKFQMELKFCEFVLGELKRGRYAEWMLPFANPVDPVALNIPDYHKYIKKPMDFRTITEKLHGGQYENAKEFETDVKLVFGNCYKFNGPSHPVAQTAKLLEEAFDGEWANKQTWISNNAPASAPQSPTADSRSEDEDEEDEDDDEEEVDERALQIASLQEKIAELSAQAVALTVIPVTKKVAKAGKKKEEKSKKSSAPKTNRKSGSMSMPASAKKPEKKAPSKPKAKPRPITMKEKAEIAERIGELSLDDTARAADFIKKGLRKIGSDIADRPDEELEFDIDQIPEEVLVSLLKLVRKNDPAPVKDTRPVMMSSKTSAASKPKKNKPMGKHEQEDAIRQLTNQIEAFHNPDLAGGSEPMAGQDAISSGDDDSGSESEEE